MTPEAHDALVERMAQAFCEHSGHYKWADTKGSVREWYLAGAAKALAVVLALVAAQPAQACHRFARWHYPFPQRCEIIRIAAAHPASKLATGEERVNVEIMLPPELMETWAREDALEKLKGEIK